MNESLAMNMLLTLMYYFYSPLTSAQMINQHEWKILKSERCAAISRNLITFCALNKCFISIDTCRGVAYPQI